MKKIFLVIDICLNLFFISYCIYIGIGLFNGESLSLYVQGVLLFGWIILTFVNLINTIYSNLLKRLKDKLDSEKGLKNNDLTK